MIEPLFKWLYKISNSILSIGKIFLRSRIFIEKYQANEDECIILGNGPSLSKVLENYSHMLKGKNLLCVNNFPSTISFELLKPKYFLFTSIEFFKPNAHKENQAVRDKIIENIIAKTDWPLILFCPNAARKNKPFIRSIKANKNITIHYFNNTPIEGLRGMSQWLMSRGLGMPRPHNVLIPSITVMINAGYNKIVLIGADHSWIPLISVDSNNVALVNQKHFYDERSSKEGKMFRNNKPRKLHEILEKFMLAFKAYFVLNDFAESKNCKVYNSTPNSFIDAFERKNLDSIFYKD